MEKRIDTDRAVREDIFSLTQFRILLSLAPADRVFSIPFPEETTERSEVLIALHDLLRRGYLQEGNGSFELSEKGKDLMEIPAGAERVFILSLPREEDFRQIWYDAGCRALSCQITLSGEIRLRSADRKSMSAEILETEPEAEEILSEADRESELPVEEFGRMADMKWPDRDAEPGLWQGGLPAAVLIDRLDLSRKDGRETCGPVHTRYVFLRGTYDRYVLCQGEEDCRLVRDSQAVREQIFEE